MPFESILQNGFLPSATRPRELPPPFDIYQEIASHIPAEVRDGTFGKTINDLPQLAINGLPPEYHSLLKMTLSVLTQVFVWEPVARKKGTARTVVPSQLSVPLVEVAETLGEPPVFTYADHTLRNWTLRDPSRSFLPDNIDTVFSYSGGEDERSFVAVHVYYESIAVDVISACSRAQKHAINQSEIGFSDAMARLSELIREMSHRFAGVKDTVSPEAFRKELRVFLMGWRNIVKMHYENCKFDASNLRGETGAQSSLLPYIEATVGTLPPHASNSRVQKALDVYHDFLQYQPKDHRHFLQNALQYTQIRRFAQSCDRSEVQEAYNDVVHAVIAFRRLHLSVIHDYIGAGAESSRGTGGSLYNEYIDGLLSANRYQLLNKDMRA